LELTERGVRARERFLDQVVGVGAVAGQAQCGRIEVSPVREQHVALDEFHNRNFI